MSKPLYELLQKSKNLAVSGNTDIAITDIVIDSRKVLAGCLYIAFDGTVSDGHDYINAAIESGAVAVLCAKKEFVNDSATFILSEDPRSAAGEIVKAFFDAPDEQLTLVGVTGTNGKTTVATLLFEFFTAVGKKCGLLSTVENRIGRDIIPSTHTTPDIVSIYRLLKQMADSGVTHCFMEVSSHAVHQRRIASLQFDLGIFTNLTHDHLDYHKTFEDYRDAKKMFFDKLPDTAFALTNKDDKNGLYMLQNTKATRYTYGLHGTADFNAKILEQDFNGTLIQLDQKEVWVNLVGEFNVYNLLAVFASTCLIGDDHIEAPVVLSKLGKVNGRFEAMQGPNRITAIVDYAHTPDALENVIGTINKIRNQSVQLITVVGCGGNRDASKRPEMGKVSARYSNKVIFTSDNPRNEDPNSIIEQMEAGVEGQHYKKILKITDRKEAIKTALMLAGTGDIVLVAGKGHETYQEINGVKHPFDDRQIIQQVFNTMQ